MGQTFLHSDYRYRAGDLFDHPLSIDMITLIMLHNQPKSFKTLGLGLELGPIGHMYRLLLITYRNLSRMYMYIITKYGNFDPKNVIIVLKLY